MTCNPLCQGIFRSGRAAGQLGQLLGDLDLTALINLGTQLIAALPILDAQADLDEAIAVVNMNSGPDRTVNGSGTAAVAPPVEKPPTSTTHIPQAGNCFRRKRFEHRRP